MKELKLKGKNFNFMIGTFYIDKLFSIINFNKITTLDLTDSRLIYKKFDFIWKENMIEKLKLKDVYNLPTDMLKKFNKIKYLDLTKVFNGEKDKKKINKNYNAVIDFINDNKNLEYLNISDNISDSYYYFSEPVSKLYNAIINNKKLTQLDVSSKNNINF
jgi:hypothetical protein